MATYPDDENQKLDFDLDSINEINKEYSFPFTFLFGEHEFVCLQDVFNPDKVGHFCFTEHIPITKPETTVLEIGSGTGVIACGLYLKHRESIRSILATDINPQAIKNTKMNFEKHNIPGKALVGDLFEPISDNHKFDLIFWDPPFCFVPEAKQLTILEKAFADPGYKTIERFFSESGKYLSESGKCIFGFIPALGDLEFLFHLAEKNRKGLKIFWSDYSDCPRRQRKILFQLIEVEDI